MKTLTFILLFLTIFSLEAKRKCFTPHSHLPEKELIKQNKVQNPFLFIRSDMNEQYVTQSGMFTIHYDVQGPFAVNLTDNNSNNVPDYIDSVAYYIDFSYEKEVEELGFDFRHTDKGLGGTDNYDIRSTILHRN